MKLRAATWAVLGVSGVAVLFLAWHATSVALGSNTAGGQTGTGTDFSGSDGQTPLSGSIDFGEVPPPPTSLPSGNVPWTTKVAGAFGLVEGVKAFWQ